MKTAKKVFNIFSIIFVLIFIFWLTQINYSDFSFKENTSAYLGLLSSFMMAFALQMIKGGIKEKK
ncbi:hypothetical protein [uncultured Polaribacter sp.]|uniref:hypothetical protein n=1 Tax=uncultured Polaribacter sp. TaxID=174711 RepID=UPI002627DDFF|nr:hypothetical protein [uncultured Polaribacter sp.]